jgi:hypothetical protein
MRLGQYYIGDRPKPFEVPLSMRVKVTRNAWFGFGIKTNLANESHYSIPAYGNTATAAHNPT